MTTDSPVPPRTSCCQHFSDCAQHNAPAEPVGPCDCGKGGPPCGGEPVPPPEWAVEMAIAATPIPHPFGAMRPAEVECFRDRLARLLASVREGGYKDGFAAGSKAAVEKPDDRA